MRKEDDLFDTLEAGIGGASYVALIAVALTWFVATEYNHLAVMIAWLISNLEIIVLRKQLRR